MERLDTSKEHKKNAPPLIKFAIITVSTSRYKKYGSVQQPDKADDISGNVMIHLLKDSGFEIAEYYLLPDNEEQIARVVRDVSTLDVQAIVISGGTGLASGDVTIEAIEPLFDKTIPGFGELFRLKSFQDVGTASMLSRASAGIVGKCAVFCLPGSPAAVELGIKELIIPEAAHIVKHAVQL
jgi:molybdenum cofactor biosynthesis protein B